MPEAIVTARVLNRAETDTLNTTEATFNRLFLADIVKAVQEIFSIPEADGTGTGFSFSLNEVLRSEEGITRITGALVQQIVEVINETLEISEDYVRRQVSSPDVEIVRVVSESISLIASHIRLQALVRVRTYLMQLHETIDPNRVFFQIVNESLNILTTVEESLIVVDLELTQVVNDILSIRDTNVLSIVTVLGNVRIVNETLTIVETANSLATEYAQIIYDLSIRAALTFTTWFNRDSE